jgi:hypothetical protein
MQISMNLHVVKTIIRSFPHERMKEVSILILAHFNCNCVNYGTSTHIWSLTHSWSWALIEKLPIVQLLQNFPAFYGTRRLITVFTRALHWSLSWARSIQSIPSHLISLRSILTLSTHLRLCLPSGLFHSGFPTNIPYAFLFSLHFLYMPCQSHFPWFDHSNYTWRRVQVMKLLIM